MARGYLRLFVDRRCYRVVWPERLVRFVARRARERAARHGPVVVYVVGATLLGLYLAFIAERTGGVFWPVPTTGFVTLTGS